MSDSKSGMMFLKRHGICRQSIQPQPAIEPGAFKAHNIELQPPLPLPEYQGFLNGDPPPDRGETTEWPHPGA